MKKQVNVPWPGLRSTHGGTLQRSSSFQNTTSPGCSPGLVHFLVRMPIVKRQRTSSALSDRYGASFLSSHGKLLDSSFAPSCSSAPGSWRWKHRYTTAGNSCGLPAAEDGVTVLQMLFGFSYMPPCLSFTSNHHTTYMRLFCKTRVCSHFSQGA